MAEKCGYCKGEGIVPWSFDGGTEYEECSECGGDGIMTPEKKAARKKLTDEIDAYVDAMTKDPHHG